MVFQAPTLMRWASALDNVALPLELTGVPRIQARERALTGLAGAGDDARPGPHLGGDAALPRPEGFRFSPLFLDNVKQVSKALALAMAA